MSEIYGELKCSSCGAPATNVCEQTFGLVCGAPLCDNCEHVVFPDGTNGGFSKLPPELPKNHVRKSEQKYLPWHRR